MLREWRTTWEVMPNKGRNYTGTFRQRPDEIFQTNNRQLISTVTQLRTSVGYFKSYLFNIPNNSFDHPLCNCNLGCKQDVRHLLTTYPLFAAERAVMKKDARQIVRKMKLQTLLYTNLGAKPLQTFLKATGIATRRWILGLQQPNMQTNTPPRGQSGLRGSGTGDTEEEEHEEEEGAEDEGPEQDASG
jgi:hypothetical protein